MSPRHYYGRARAPVVPDPRSPELIGILLAVVMVAVLALGTFTYLQKRNTDVKSIHQNAYPSIQRQ